MAGTIFVLVILIVVVTLIIKKLIKDRKNGGCGCGCSGCSHKCH